MLGLVEKLEEKHGVHLKSNFALSELICAENTPGEEVHFCFLFKTESCGKYLILQWDLLNI